MKYRVLGNTGIEISEIGFGCGPTAGLMVKGTTGERERVIASALDNGINFFDTASVYGDGLSETFLGETLGKLKAYRPIIATKLAIHEAELGDIPRAVERSIDQSLKRLSVESVDIIQLHNRVTDERKSMQTVGIAPLLTYEEVMGENGVVETLEILRKKGKIKYLGFTTYGGDLESIYKMINSKRFQLINCAYNILNPSAGLKLPDQYRGENYGQVIDAAAKDGLGTAVIRVLAGGALSGTETMHRLAKKPLKSDTESALDSERSKLIAALNRDSNQSLAQFSIRFALMKNAISTVIVGISSQDQLNEAVECSRMGQLDDETVEKINQFHQNDFGTLQESGGFV